MERDQITEIVNGWARERPDLPTRSVPVTSLIWRLARELHTRRAEALRAAGTDQATLDLLANLRRLGEPYEATPGHLAHKCGVTAAAISLRLRRAGERGWVERTQTADDGRRVLVRLTPAGVAAADQYAGHILHHDDRLVANVSDTELAELERLLRRFADAISHGDGSA